MTTEQTVRAWKDPDSAPPATGNPSGDVDLASLTGGQQADTLIPFFCEKTLFQGTCAMGPTVGCC